jgi:hypothetical protein
MPPQIKEGQKLKRRIRVYGIESDILIELNSQGLSFKAPGTKLGVYATWQQVVEACDTPANVPSKHQGRPLEFLKSQTLEHQKRMTKRLAKKIFKEVQERQ